MAEQLYFGRHTKVFLEQGTNVWEVPVLDGFSFSQATNSSEVTLQEMESTDGVSRRGRQMFNDSYAPAEWSFSTYVRPVKSTAGATNGWEDATSDAFHHSVEEPLWANFLAVNSWNAVSAAGSAQTLGAITSSATDRDEGVYTVTIGSNGVVSSGAGVGSVFEITIDSTGQDSNASVVIVAGGSGHAAADVITVPVGVVGGTGGFTFPIASIDEKGYWDKAILSSLTNTVYRMSNSNRSVLGTFNLYFDLGNCAGSGTSQPYKITDCVVNSVSIDFEIDGIATLNWSGFGSIITDEIAAPAATITEGTNLTSNFIRNRLTTLNITAADTVNYPGEASNGVYNVVLTGGSISLENNITFLTPDTLCKVDQPIGHITGSRNIGGSFTCYLNTDTGSSADLFEDLIGATDVVTNSFDLNFSVGGSTAPKLQIQLPACHLEVPSHSIEDVIAVETTFSALPGTISAANEAVITYTSA